MGPAPAVAAVRAAVRSALAARSVVAPQRRDSPRVAPLGGHGRVLVACSGGADSVALAAATAFEAARAGVPAGLVTVDHGLQNGSAEQAARVAALGYELGLDPVETIRVDVGTAGGPEGAARTARYAALAATAAAWDATVLLGHTLDDQAETVLLGLGRGSGPRSIAGMAVRDGVYVRPFLGLRRATTEAACLALGLQPWDDPHNSDPSYQRVRLRREVLPLLEDVLQGGVAEALARTADLWRDDLEALDGWACAVINTPSGAPEHAPTGLDHRNGAGRDDGAGLDVAGLDVAGLEPLPRAVRTRVLRAWATQAGAGPLSAERTAALDALVTDWHGQGPIDLPGGVAVHRASGRLVMYPSDPRG
jgi:tRNA(Ile)-lysidine synthase